MTTAQAEWMTQAFGSLAELAPPLAAARGLDERSAKVLVLLAHGLTPAVIAPHFDVSPPTLRGVITGLYAATGHGSRPPMVLSVVRAGQVPKVPTVAWPQWTTRQLDMIEAVALGWADQEIAQHAGIARESVVERLTAARVEARRVCPSLTVSDRTQLALVAHSVGAVA